MCLVLTYSQDNSQLYRVFNDFSESDILIDDFEGALKAVVAVVVNMFRIRERTKNVRLSFDRGDSGRTNRATFYSSHSMWLTT